jgi:hypothetical protein
MADAEEQDWFDEGTAPFEDAQPSSSEPSVMDERPEEEPTNSTEEEATESPQVADLEPSVEFPNVPQSAPWSLPIRAAPLLAQTGDLVTEYPLKQSVDGRTTTSIVVDDALLRVVDTELGDDGHRRMKVRLTVKQGITGFNHQHNELMHQHQLLWIGCFVVGFCLTLTSSVAFGVLGALSMIIGIRSWILMHLETHHLEFSNQGGSHALELRAYGTNRGFFRASMAMIGPVMADFIRTGSMNVDELEDLHASLLAPPMAPIPEPQQEPIIQPESTPLTSEVPLLPMVVTETPVGPPSSPVPAPPVQIPVPPAPLPASPMAIPPPPKQIPAPPLPAAPAILPPPPALAPQVKPLPPAPMPPPMPLPVNPGLAPLPAPLSPPGLPLPLDAPLPAAPEVAVAGSPVEETLSKDEQNELLSELS